MESIGIKQNYPQEYRKKGLNQLPDVNLNSRYAIKHTHFPDEKPIKSIKEASRTFKSIYWSCGDYKIEYNDDPKLYTKSSKK